MIRLTLILLAALFAAFFIFGKDLSEADKARLHPQDSDESVEPLAVVEPEVAPAEEDKIRPVNPNEETGVDRSIPPVTEPRVISQDPSVPSQPVVVDTTPPVTEGQVEQPPVPGADGQVVADPPARDENGVVDDAPLQSVTETTWYVAADKVNLRAGKGTEFAVLGAAFFAEPVTVLSSTAEEWVQVRLADGTEAFVKGEFLSPVEPQQ